MKRLSYKKNNKIINKRLSKINGGRPPIEDNQCNIVATLYGHTASVNSVAFHPTAPLMATGSSDWTMKLWLLSPDGSGPICVATLQNYSIVLCLAFHSTAPLLATGNGDMTAKLWRLWDDNSSATCVATLEGHHGSITSVAFHPATPLLATGSRDNTTKLWRLSSDNLSATCVVTLYGHTAPVNSVTFHPTAPLLATGSNDLTAKLWRFSPDGSKATCVSTLQGHFSHVWSVVFHPTAPLLATGSSDGTAKLWRLSYDKTVKLWLFSSHNWSANCVATLEGHISWVNSLAFHPTAPFLATGSSDYIVKLWRLSDDNSSATCVATIQGHGMQVNSMAFHPTAPLLATGSGDYTVKLWRCKILIGPYNNFILYPKITGVNESICNKLCPLCNINLCMKNVANPNNINGYIVKLSNGTPTSDVYQHYKCIHRYLLHEHLDINDVSIASETIHDLLNMDNKADALIGVDFYN